MCSALTILLLGDPAFAADTAANQGREIDILPAKSLSGEMIEEARDQNTAPAIKLTPDKSEIIHLEREAASIVVGNPNHLNVMAENAKTLVLVGRLPGATHFMALDKNGDTIMQRHVIVASPKDKYVRIRKSCAKGGVKNCTETQVYYCPDMCHEVVISQEEDESSGNAAAAKAAEKAAENGGQNVTNAGISEDETSTGQ